MSRWVTDLGSVNSQLVEKLNRQTELCQTLHLLTAPRVGLLVLRLVEAVGQAALPAVMAVKVARHEDAGTTLISGTLAPQPVDFTVLVDLETKDDRRCRSTDQLPVTDHMMGPVLPCSI